MPRSPLGRPIPRPARSFLVTLPILLALPIVPAMAVAASGPADASADERPAAADPALGSCPVQPDQEARPEHSTVYEGRAIYFCCSFCVRRFEAEPERYIANLALPPVAAGPPAGPTQLELLRRHARWLVPALLVLLLLRIAARWRRQGLTVADGLLRRRVALATVFVLALVGSQLYLGWRLRAVSAEARELRDELYYRELEELLHNTTYYDYGRPPIPAKPPVEPRVRATFYRGNDERDPRLFNNGQYLTSLFHVSLRAADGVDLDEADLGFGDSAADRELYLRLEIERAPHTADYFFDPSVMSTIFLTANSHPFLGEVEPVTDRVNLITLEPGWRWEALYPLGRVAAAGETHLEAVVYIAEQWTRNGRELGASFHNAVQLDVRFQDGRLAAGSDLWMGSLFRPRKSPVWKIPPDEWFSHRPIPPLPAPNVDDETLLGISDRRSPAEIPDAAVATGQPPDRGH